MTFDLAVLGILAVAALVGVLKGAARQIGTALGAVAAWFAAEPAGRFFGSALAAKLGASLTIGTMVASVGAFLTIYVAVQLLSSAIIKRLLEGRGKERAGADRLLGLVLGTLKMAAVVYVVLCGLAFFERNVQIAGRTVTFTPKDSRALAFVREHNLLESQHFSGVEDLLALARAREDPANAKRLQTHPDFVALLKDPRFRQLLDSPQLKQAQKSGDARALFQSDLVLQLLQDDAAFRRVERILER